MGANLVSLGLRREDPYTWRDMLVKRATEYGLEHEVLASYDAAIARGAEEDDAALEAALEWDVAESLPEDDEEESYED